MKEMYIKNEYKVKISLLIWYILLRTNLLIFQFFLLLFKVFKKMNFYG